MYRLVFVVGCVMLMWIVAPAPPAVASHDSYEAGSVILRDGPGANDQVVVVFASDADEAQIQRRVEAAAADAGAELTDVSVMENTDPDTLRVRGRTVLGERTGVLRGRVPAEQIAGWRVFGADTQLYLSVGRWAQVDGAEPVDGGDHAVTGDRDVAYRISGWALLIPLLLVVAAAVVPYVGLRAYAATVIRRGGEPDEQLHRIRRALLIALFAIPAAVVAVLVATGTVNWLELALSEVAGGVRWPVPVLSLLGLLGFALPFIVVLIAATAAVMPYDRRLRGTEQDTRAGVGQALRGGAVGLLPIMVWLAVLPFVSRLDVWLIVPIVFLFAIGSAAIGPLIMNAIMTTRPLDETLRQRLLEQCAEQGMRVRDARMLDSRGGRVANAAISGILPRLRYMYLTDHIIEILDDDELDAVVAHEIAHGKGHHLLIKLVAGLVAIGAVGLVLALGGAELFSRLADLGVLALVFGLPAVFVIVLLLVHGVVGVALEQRADDHAADHVGVQPLVRALDKLADANKAKRRTGWLWNVLQQHPGMEQRIQRLNERARTDRDAADAASGAT